MKLHCYFLLLTVGFSILIACQPKNSDESNQENKEIVEIQQSPKKMKLNKYQVDFVSGEIPIKEAAKMISNGLNNELLGMIGKRLSIGGYFKESDFEIVSPDVGIVLWPCYNPSGEMGYPKFFLVAEKVERYDSSVTRIRTNRPGKNLIMPIQVTNYQKSDIDTSATRMEITNRKNTISIPNPIPKLIDSIRTMRYVKNFEGIMMDFSPIGDSSLCKYGQYFFEANRAYQTFMDPPDLAFVYYYMGFEWDKEHKPNYFRPILVGVKKEGDVIGSTFERGDDGTLLQKSVPPPPEQE